MKKKIIFLILSTLSCVDVGATTPLDWFKGFFGTEVAKEKRPLSNEPFSSIIPGVKKKKTKEPYTRTETGDVVRRSDRAIINADGTIFIPDGQHLSDSDIFGILNDPNLRGIQQRQRRNRSQNNRRRSRSQNNQGTDIFTL